MFERHFVFAFGNFSTIALSNAERDADPSRHDAAVQLVRCKGGWIALAAQGFCKPWLILRPRSGLLPCY
jgi:hypothetical protein